MRDLATGRYTADQVEAALRSPSAQYGCRFEILGPDLDLIDDLEAGPGGVIDAAVEVNVDQAIKGSMDLRMLPVEDLRDQTFTRRIKPYFRLLMGDGGWAEWPQGVFVWGVPDRDLIGLGQEEWSITLGDQSQILDLSGPGSRGFTVHTGNGVTDAIKRCLRRAGFTDTSGVVDSDDEFDEPKTWVFSTPRTKARRQREFYEALLTQNSGPSAQARAIRFAIEQKLVPLRERAPDADNDRVSWLEIIEDCCDAIGYSSPWFDGDGVPRVEPHQNLTTVDPDHVVATDPDGLLLTAATSHELDRVKNRFLLKSENARVQNRLAVVDADELMPNHPLCASKIGFHIDGTEIDRVAPSHAALVKRARKRLFEALSTYETIDTNTLAWPVHEAFDVVGFRWDNDPDYEVRQVFHQRRHTLDLFTGEMARNLRRVYQ